MPLFPPIPFHTRFLLIMPAYASLIRDVPDFPKPGIIFKDITPMLGDAQAFAQLLDDAARLFAGEKLDRVVGIESRGFIFGAPLAVKLGVGFVPVRKPGKLPADTIREEYALEYGTDALEIHRDALPAGARVLVVDDVLATGGTLAATARLVEKAGGEVSGIFCAIELSFLDGRAKLPGRSFRSLITY